MSIIYQARWVTKDRVHSLRRTGEISKGVLLDTIRGYIVVEPTGSKMGDGKPLTSAEAEFELSPVWCRDRQAMVTEARKRLGF